MLKNEFVHSKRDSRGWGLVPFGAKSSLGLFFGSLAYALISFLFVLTMGRNCCLNGTSLSDSLVDSDWQKTYLQNIVVFLHMFKVKKKITNCVRASKKRAEVSASFFMSSVGCSVQKIERMPWFYNHFWYKKMPEMCLRCP